MYEQEIRINSKRYNCVEHYLAYKTFGCHKLLDGTKISKELETEIKAL